MIKKFLIMKNHITNKNKKTKLHWYLTVIFITIIIQSNGQGYYYNKTIKTSTAINCLSQNCHSMVPFSNGTYLLCGQEQDTMPSNNNRSIFLAVIDGNADETFHRTFKESGSEGGTKAIIGKDSCIYILGNSTSTQSYMYLIKLNKNLQIIWEKRYQGYPFNLFVPSTDMIVTNDSNLMLLSNVGLIKMNTSGNILWKRILNNSFSSSMFIQTMNGDIMVAGSYGPVPWQSKMIIQRYNANGYLKWSKSYNSIGSLGTTGGKILEITANNYVVIGGHYHDPSKGLFMRIDSSGAVLFKKFYQIGLWLGGGYTFYTDIIPVNNGEYLISGSSNGLVLNGYIPFLQKIDSTGTTLWVKHRDSTDYAYLAYTITQCNNGYLLAGNKNFGDVQQMTFFKIPFAINVCDWHNTSIYVDSMATIDIADFPESIDTVLNIPLTTPNFTTIDFLQPYTIECDTIITSITVLNEFESNDIIIYPNPSNDFITIENKQPAEIEISNIQGQFIKSFMAIGNKTNIDVSSFAKGLYFIIVKTEKGIITKKFIKE